MRDANLIPLTHDHHHALAACRRLRVAAEGDEATRSKGTRAFLEFFASETVTHFREEEEQLFPLIVGVVDAQATLQKALIDHLQIHAAIADVRTEATKSSPSAISMIGVATLLEGHIRFEEKILFPLIERLVGADTLRLLSFGPRDRIGPSKIAS
ncbi:MAG: hypothetical protein QOG04_1935 [Actinomycetota bacterium]|jgi:iron-sulfur cluster repair protein YtfE (RIC family)|nr:hypothetical protein [Actinomycetota bacterium]